MTDNLQFASRHNRSETRRGRSWVLDSACRLVSSNSRQACQVRSGSADNFELSAWMRPGMLPGTCRVPSTRSFTVPSLTREQGDPFLKFSSRPTKNLMKKNSNRSPGARCFLPLRDSGCVPTHLPGDVFRRPASRNIPARSASKRVSFGFTRWRFVLVLWSVFFDRSP